MHLITRPHVTSALRKPIAPSAMRDVRPRSPSLLLPKRLRSADGRRAEPSARALECSDDESDGCSEAERAHAHHAARFAEGSGSRGAERGLTTRVTPTAPAVHGADGAFVGRTVHPTAAKGTTDHDEGEPSLDRAARSEDADDEDDVHHAAFLLPPAALQCASTCLLAIEPAYEEDGPEDEEWFVQQQANERQQMDEEQLASWFSFVGQGGSLDSWAVWTGYQSECPEAPTVCI